MAAYAQGTKVDPSRSRLEIERLLDRHGVQKRAVLFEPGLARVQFFHEGWGVEMRIQLPRLDDAPKRNRLGYLTDVQRRQWVEQRTRERWRQLLLVLRAKFTALDEGVETFEECFLAHLVLAGRSVGEALLPALRDANERGQGFEGLKLLGPGGAS